MMKVHDGKLLEALYELFKNAEETIGVIAVNSSNGVQITHEKFKEFFPDSKVFYTSVFNGVSYNHYQVTIGDIRICSCEVVTK